MDEINVDLLIEFIRGEDILWLVNPENTEYWKKYEWIDFEFQKEFENYMINLADENFKQAVEFIKHTYWNECSREIRKMSGKGEISELGVDGAFLFYSLLGENEKFQDKIDRIWTD